MKRFYSLILFLALAGIVIGDTGQNTPLDPTQLTMEELYTVKPFRGKTARMIQFSEDDSYLAFLWNSFDEDGYDLYVYDLSSQKLIRVTSLGIMKQFDPPEDTERFLKKSKP